MADAFGSNPKKQKKKKKKGAGSRSDKNGGANGALSIDSPYLTRSREISDLTDVHADDKVVIDAPKLSVEEQWDTKSARFYHEESGGAAAVGALQSAQQDFERRQSAPLLEADDVIEEAGVHDQGADVTGTEWQLGPEPNHKVKHVSQEYLTHEQPEELSGFPEPPADLIQPEVELVDRQESNLDIAGMHGLISSDSVAAKVDLEEGEVELPLRGLPEDLSVFTDASKLRFEPPEQQHEQQSSEEAESLAQPPLDMRGSVSPKIGGSPRNVQFEQHESVTELSYPDTLLPPEHSNRPRTPLTEFILDVSLDQPASSATTVGTVMLERSVTTAEQAGQDNQGSLMECEC